MPLILTMPALSITENSQCVQCTEIQNRERTGMNQCTSTTRLTTKSFALRSSIKASSSLARSHQIKHHHIDHPRIDRHIDHPHSKDRHPHNHSIQSSIINPPGGQPKTLLPLLLAVQQHEACLVRHQAPRPMPS